MRDPNDNRGGPPQGAFECFKYFINRVTELPQKVAQQQRRSFDAPRLEDRAHDEYMKLKPSIPSAQANAQHDVQLYAPPLSPVMFSFRSWLPKLQNQMIENKKRLGMDPRLNWYDIWVAHLIAARQAHAPTMPTGYLYYNSGVLFHSVFKYTMSKVDKDSDLAGRFISTLAHEFNNVNQHPKEAEVLRNGVGFAMAAFGGLLLCAVTKKVPFSFVQRVSSQVKVTPSTFSKAMGYSCKAVGTGSLAFGTGVLVEENILMKTQAYPTYTLEDWTEQQERRQKYEKQRMLRMQNPDPDFFDDTNLFIGWTPSAKQSSSEEGSSKV